MTSRLIPRVFFCLSLTASCGSVEVAIDAGNEVVDSGGSVDAQADAQADAQVAADAQTAADAQADAQIDGPPPCTGLRTFAYSGVVESFTVPACASSITVEVFGAQGGGGPTVSGGLGARMRGDFAVIGGEVLSVLVGGEGVAAANDSDQGGGTGGGGTFVVRTGNSPVIIAGGGGGALYSLADVGGQPRTLDGGPGQITANGQAGAGGGAGGIDGGGGVTWPWPGWHSGTGGGGLLTDGSGPSNGSSIYGSPNQPGLAFVNGGGGGVGGSAGRSGGFGGGGSAGFTGGGGGGYSGGGSSTYGDGTPGASTYGGGGGGSINNGGTNSQQEVGVRAGDGVAIFSW